MSAPGSTLLARPTAGLWKRALRAEASYRPRSALVVRSETGGVQQLLQRDKRWVAPPRTAACSRMCVLDTPYEALATTRFSAEACIRSPHLQERGGGRRVGL
jgi:hypothetical protein